MTWVANQCCEMSGRHQTGGPLKTSWVIRFSCGSRLLAFVSFSFVMFVMFLSTVFTRPYLSVEAGRRLRLRLKQKGRSEDYPDALSQNKEGIKEPTLMLAARCRS